MPPKRNQRRASVSPEPKSSSNRGLSSSTKPAEDDTEVGISQLQPKPCHTCGREITPRAKWKRNWSAIRYCSEQCRSWPGTIKVFTYLGGDEAEAKPKAGPSKGEEATPLERCLDRDPGKPKEPAQTTEPGTSPIPRHELLVHQVDLDAWIEATIWQVAQTSSRHGGKGGASLKTLQDVAQAMDNHMDQLNDPQLAHAIQEYLKHTHAGLRELIRRSARRLVVMPADTWASTRRGKGLVPQNSTATLALTQGHGKQRLRTLTDVSFAKGEIEVSIAHD